MLSPYGKPHTTIIQALSIGCLIALVALQWWWGIPVALVIAFCLLAFFRDPKREVPSMKGHFVAPADGRISSVHTLDHFEPFDGPAVCIRIFLSLFDVHVNRSPMYGRVVSITHKPGKYLNALKAESAELNESVTIVLCDPAKDQTIGAVRQIAGAIARRIVCGINEGEIVQRGQRIGLIKFGSTTELYLPDPKHVEVQVQKGKYVYGGSTVLAIVHQSAMPSAPAPEIGPAEKAESASALES